MGVARKMDQEPINRRMESPDEFGARLTVAREDALRKRLIGPLGARLFIPVVSGRYVPSSRRASPCGFVQRSRKTSPRRRACANITLLTLAHAKQAVLLLRAENSQKPNLPEKITTPKPDPTWLGAGIGNWHTQAGQRTIARPCSPLFF